MTSVHMRGARFSILCSIAMPLVSIVAVADDRDQTKEDMQRALNQQVMSSPFNPGDVRKAEAFALEAKKQGIVPAPQPPAYWATGWTCANLTGYRYYNYHDYQNCVYYHSYYGRYWR